MSGRRIVFGAAAVALLAAGCQWRQAGYGPEHRRHNTVEDGVTLANVASLSVKWSTPLEQVDDPENPQLGMDSEPIVADGRVYVGHTLGTDANGGAWVRALDPDTGATVWNRRVATGNGSIFWPVATARSGSTLSFGFTGLFTPTGSTLSQCTGIHGDLAPATGAGTVTSDGVHVSPAVTSGAVAVRTRKRDASPPDDLSCQSSTMVVRAKDATSGQDLWAATLPGPTLGPISAWYASFMPTIADGRVFVAWGPTLYAFRLNGCGQPTCAPIWTANLGSEVSGTSPPVVTNGGQVLVVTASGDLVAVAATNGATRWRAHLGWTLGSLDLGPRPGVAVAGNVAYVVTPTDTGVLQAFGANGCGASVCTPLWTATLPNGFSAPTVAGGVVYVGAHDAVAAYDAAGCGGAATCPAVATLPVEGWNDNVTVAQGKVFVSGRGRVTALALP
jgi:outer membrane protein assembly factor BamB